MITKRIVPCLDVENGRVVKGINFVNIKEVGSVTEIAKRYQEQGADELVFLDITATYMDRKTMTDTVRDVASNVFMPLTVGGGITTVDEMRELLRAGADKISLNSAAVKNPDLITQGASVFGSQCIVVAIDAKMNDGGNYNVFTAGGRIDTGLDAVEWAIKAEKLGAGELLVTSMDADGTKKGYDIDMLNAIADKVSIPIIASGGCGRIEDFSDVFLKSNVDAALAASLFHYGELTVKEVKNHLFENGINVRL